MLGMTTCAGVRRCGDVVSGRYLSPFQHSFKVGEEPAIGLPGDKGQ